MARPRPVPRVPLVVKKGSRQRRRVVLVHADAGIDDFELHDLPARAFGQARAQRKRPALGHGVDRIEHQVDQCIAHLAFHGRDRREGCQPAPAALRSPSRGAETMSLQRARVRSSTCRTSRLMSTGTSETCGSRTR